MKRINIGKIFLILCLITAVLLPAMAEDQFKPLDQDEFAPIETNDNALNNSDKTNFFDAVLKAVNENNIVFLIAALILGTIIFFIKKSRIRYLMLLASVVFFGFYLGACNCSVGAFTKVINAVFFDHKALLGILLLIIIPIISTLFSGRIFCGYVCPFGAIQDLIAVRDKLIKISPKLEKALGYLRHVFFVLIILISFIQHEYIFAKISPFKAIFNLNGGVIQLVFAGLILVLSLFIYRPFCRFACPYSIVLEFAGKFSLFKIKKDRSGCGTCRACAKKCLINAIKNNCTIDDGKCIRCGECYNCLRK